MIVSQSKIARKYLYFLVTITILSPAISFYSGIPRLDTLNSPFVVMASTIFLAMSRFPTAILKLVFFQIFLFPFGLISLLAGPPVEAIPDVFLLALPALFIILFHQGFNPLADPENAIRKWLTFFAILVFLPVIVESATGLRFAPIVQNEPLSSIMVKGSFFNPNDMSSVAAMLTLAILYFYFLCQTSPREKLIGGILALGLIASVLIGGSRTAALLLILALLLFAFIHAHFFTRIALVPFMLLGLYSLNDISWLEPILLWAMGIPLLEFSAAKMHLALFFFENDNSISYRSEIIEFFFANFEFVINGYGPRNYGDFFVGLSNSLAATNPHSFFIESYLAFGIFGFSSCLAFLFSIVIFIWNSDVKNKTGRRQRQFALVIYVAFLALSFVPSSIFRLGIIWAPLLIVVWHRITIDRRTANAKLNL